MSRCKICGGIGSNCICAPTWKKEYYLKLREIEALERIAEALEKVVSEKRCK